MKISEKQLRNIIKESLQKILKESAYDINSPEYKQMYDSGNKWYDGRETEYDDTDKEIEDYEALPDKARHPYGAEIPDFSDRRKNHYTNVDNLAEKEPNSILKKQQEKREYQKDLEKAKQFSPSFHIWCRDNGISREERENLTDDELVGLYRWYLDDKEERRRQRWT